MSRWECTSRAARRQYSSKGSEQLEAGELVRGEHKEADEGIMDLV